MTKLPEKAVGCALSADSQYEQDILDAVHVEIYVLYLSAFRFCFALFTISLPRSENAIASCHDQVLPLEATYSAHTLNRSAILNGGP